MIIRERPSFFRVIFTDYLSLVAFVLPLFLVGTEVYNQLTSDGIVIDESTLRIAVMVAVGIVIFLWRYSRINNYFNEGKEEPATINGASFFRGRGTISFIYTYQGSKYQSKSIVLSSAHTKAFKVGREVVALIDNNNPKKAIIKELFQ